MKGTFGGEVLAPKTPNPTRVDDRHVPFSRCPLPQDIATGGGKVGAKREVESGIQEIRHELAVTVTPP
jgi:hypothetical protein